MNNSYVDEDKINILMIDDRPENLLALEAIIDCEDYNIVKAYSGEEGLKYLLKYDFATILLDVQMPGIDGFGTAKIIKAREKTKNVPIIFITANNMDSEHIFTGYAIGAIDYILKPVDPFILKSKVEGFIDIYKMNQRLIKQAESLTAKTEELKRTNIELSKTTSQLQISEALSNVISDTSMDSMIIFDKDGVILKVNPAVQKMFQYRDESILGKTINALFKSGDSLAYIKTVLKAISNLEIMVGDENLKEVTAIRRDGTTFPAEIQIGMRFVQEDCIMACTIRDITKRKDYEQKITHMAYHDGLTHLPNRRFFNDQLVTKLNQAKHSNQLLAMMYLDIDHFKYVNDSLGHIVGDHLLQKISNRLKDCLRNGDFLARIGGDEFNILLPDTDREEALEIAERLVEAFKEPIYIDSYELFITTCIGISIFPYDGEDSLSLIKNADAALYRAKEQGKNNCKVYHSGMNIQSYKTFVIKNDLRKAIDNEEFSLVYQPRIDIKTGEVKSAEALIRWHHPIWGLILPSEFIPLAEEIGLISTIGEWVLMTALKQSKSWQEAGLLPVRMAVNFSAQQFLQKDLIDKIQRILLQAKVKPHLLEIEITESVIMGNEKTVIKTLNDIRRTGVHISIDDFGTGYSSLNYLSRFRVDALKIDKSFVKNMSDSVSDCNLVSTIISLAHSLEMTVIAEGVEKEEQLTILRNYKCEEFQGYLFSPPIAPNDFKALLVINQEDTSDVPKVNGLADGNNYLKKVTKIENNLNNEGLEQNKEVLDKALILIQRDYSISSREIDVFKLIVNGLNNKEIANELFISEHTVKNHVTNIFRKLTVNDRLQAMAKVYQTIIETGKSLNRY
ncbi:EAL domain-containing protein [Pullulanibacillus sp. KACC 23026]|uniref:EAL domain-containing protein n=1 Tax=Pullulanibacillus sp. KACC 23026 TaxID=3028315 RepID=UPI0023AEECA8|nr:EAL domain-containing protein [Pullulanibacillus sp. KACC 23026]WEG10968.1 EAL domain-containing protein [Pullulanibacillus sp. KACC 23026]